MRVVSYQHPGLAVLGVLLLLPLALRLPDGVFHEVPLLVRDDESGLLVPTVQSRISYMGLN